jgi:hypothetical protein
LYKEKAFYSTQETMVYFFINAKIQRKKEIRKTAAAIGLRLMMKLIVMVMMFING